MNRFHNAEDLAREWVRCMRQFITLFYDLWNAFKVQVLCDACYLVKVINLAKETAGTDYWREPASILHTCRVQKANNLNIKNSPRGWNRLCTIVWLWMTQICHNTRFEGNCRHSPTRVAPNPFSCEKHRVTYGFLAFALSLRDECAENKKCLTRRWYTAAPLLLMIGCAELLFGVHEDRRHIHSFWTDNHRVLESNKQNFISKKRSISFHFFYLESECTSDLFPQALTHFSSRCSRLQYDNVEACLVVLRNYSVPGVENVTANDIIGGRLKAVLSLFFSLSRFKQASKLKAPHQKPPQSQPHSSQFDMMHATR